MARLVREEMGKCYWREGVNHLEKCGHLRGTYTVNGETGLVGQRSIGQGLICMRSRTIPGIVEGEQD
jgi:hypothetical protein